MRFNRFDTKLKLENRKWYPSVFLAVCVAVAGLWRALAHGHRPELLISALGVVLGVLYFVYQQHLNETKLFKELFLEFNKRYRELNDTLNAVRPYPVDGVLSKSEQDCLYDYFNLCAEEYFFFSAGYIDQKVWDAWQGGMKYFFDAPRIRRQWNEDGAASSYYGFTPPN